jgi:hypothetical protein
MIALGCAFTAESSRSILVSRRAISLARRLRTPPTWVASSWRNTASLACTSALVATLSWIASKMTEATRSAFDRSMPASSIQGEPVAHRSRSSSFRSRKPAGGPQSAVNDFGKPFCQQVDLGIV